jgi:16S rRNA (guanine966-N2)-methyltransferase
MRIVGGMWRGRPLEAPDGRDVTRPTTDRTREQMASMVLSAFDLDLSDVRILDAFAGSGAIGLELLSRGAAHCTFVDADRKAVARIKRNVSSLGASRAQYDVMGGDVAKLVSRGKLPGAPFSLVVLDPPYAMEAARVSELVRDLDAHALLGGDARILYEHDSRAPGLVVPGFSQVRGKSHGTTTFEILSRGEADHE